MRSKTMKFKVGDTVAFRRAVSSKCEALTRVRATVTEVAGDWIFMTEACGANKVMPADTLCKVAPNGVVLELV
jgi:hypothetical protein